MDVSTSSRAYDLHAVLQTCALACDAADPSDTSHEFSALERTLQVAMRLAGELIDAVEELEQRARKGAVHEPREAA